MANTDSKKKEISQPLHAQSLKKKQLKAFLKEREIQVLETQSCLIKRDEKDC